MFSYPERLKQTVVVLNVNGTGLQHNTGLTGGPVNRRELLSFQDGAHAERYPPKWRTGRLQHPCQLGGGGGNRTARAVSKAE